MAERCWFNLKGVDLTILVLVKQPCSEGAFAGSRIKKVTSHVDVTTAANKLFAAAAYFGVSQRQSGSSYEFLKSRVSAQFVQARIPAQRHR